MKQEYKINHGEFDTFFFAHSFKSALYYAKEYMNRNAGQSMKLYKLSNKPKPFPKWELME